MHVRSFLLCDFAQVREGLLFVSSGGITRLNRPIAPAPMAVMAAIVLEVGPTEVDLVHEIKVSVTDAESATEVAGMVAAFQALTNQNLLAGEPMQVPLIADLRPVGLEKFGRYDVRLSGDGDLSDLLTVWMVEAPH